MRWRRSEFWCSNIVADGILDSLGLGLMVGVYEDFLEKMKVEREVL